jgi:hypothetical protein
MKSHDGSQGEARHDYESEGLISHFGEITGQRAEFERRSDGVRKNPRAK